MDLSQAWFDLCPATPELTPLLGRLAGRLDDPSTREELLRCEREAIYPERVMADLRDAGLAGLFAEPVEPSGPSTVTALHLCGFNALAARRSGSIALDVGIFGLALLPLYIAGTAEQRRRAFDAMRGGAAAAMMLTEWEHGSDLLANEARATPGRLDDDGRFVADASDPTHFRVDGEKHLINGGTEASLLVALLRSGDPAGDPDSPFGAKPPFTLCMIERDDTVHPVPAYDTLPVPATDISGARFEGTLVSLDDVVRAPGRGFALTQQALTLSRGGFASLAAGAAWRAWELALAHAHQRELYGAPILALDPIADHLMRLGARARLAAALACKTTAFMNARGQGAAYYTAAGKLACCALAEAAVDEGRQILGARALIHEHPYAQVVRDVPVYGVIDGTSHVMKAQIAAMLIRMRRGGEVGPSLDEVGEVYTTPPRPLIEAAPRRRRPVLLPLDAHARALSGLEGRIDAGPLVALADAALDLFGATRRRGSWVVDASARFAVADLVAGIEALFALLELSDPVRREALGMAPRRDDTPLAARLDDYATCWFGARLAERAERAAVLIGTEPAGLAQARRAWLAELPGRRERLREALRDAEPPGA